MDGRVWSAFTFQRGSCDAPELTGAIAVWGPMFPAATRILYAEDNENDFVLLRYAFTQTKLPAELLFVSSGPAAIDYLTTQPEPALVVLDINLPGVSGFDVLEWLRTQKPQFHAPVILWTASLRPYDLERATALRATQLAKKPGTLEGYVTFARELATRLRGG
ncbi:MAG TPA: response regulator [Candidatus Synoicihabitans sp.]|nr:response regulator [Candidatus Synoicihabitans sp.]